ncbi:hypothetical protein RJT34_14603 [Clitoria ternatea]|uniref:Uncharacterized protein n=1 Tax=Clitoria ternatea TaxID=43366 RepID=A0AAN9JQP2_CLITE
MGEIEQQHSKMVSGEAHPKMPTSSFPIPLPGRNRRPEASPWPWRKRPITQPPGNGLPLPQHLLLLFKEKQLVLV